MLSFPRSIFFIQLSNPDSNFMIFIFLLNIFGADNQNPSFIMAIFVDQNRFVFDFLITSSTSSPMGGHILPVHFLLLMVPELCPVWPYYFLPA